MKTFNSIIHCAATCIVLIAVFSGCISSSNKQEAIDVQSTLNDSEFVGHEAVKIETVQQIFTLDESAKRFVKASTLRYQTKTQQIESLASAIFNHSSLNLLYQADANTTAQDTFEKRAANCLSMSIMTYSLMAEAGLRPDFQQVLIPEYWTRRSGYNFINSHVNLVVQAVDNDRSYEHRKDKFIVDFDPQAGLNGFKHKTLSKHHIVAMFYNNKAAEALVNERYLASYAYLKAAVMTAPRFGSAWVNLGLLYKKHGMNQLSEKSYLHAISLDNTNYTAKENLSLLYASLGHQDKADALMRIVLRNRKTNPYYHMMLADEAFENGEIETSVSFYREAIRLNSEQHLFYFGLAKAYFELGEFSQSARNMRLAKRWATNLKVEDFYATKAEMMSAKKDTDANVSMRQSF